MAKPELGTKRVCPETGRKFYDLNKDPVISPYTGKVVPVEVVTSRSRPDSYQSPRQPERERMIRWDRFWFLPASLP